MHWSVHRREMLKSTSQKPADALSAVGPLHRRPDFAKHAKSAGWGHIWEGALHES